MLRTILVCNVLVFILKFIIYHKNSIAIKSSIINAIIDKKKLYSFAFVCVLLFTINQNAFESNSKKSIQIHRVTSIDRTHTTIVLQTIFANTRFHEYVY